MGVDAAGASITNGLIIYGMFEVAGTNNIDNNTVYIGGSGVVSSSNTYAFVSNVSTGTRTYRNNIFMNARDNASGGGKNYAVSLFGLTGATSDFNDLYAPGTGWICWCVRRRSIDARQLARSNGGRMQIHSRSSKALKSADGTAVTADLHLQNTSPMLNVGTTIATVTNDFDGDDVRKTLSIRSVAE